MDLFCQIYQGRYCIYRTAVLGGQQIRRRSGNYKFRQTTMRLC